MDPVLLVGIISGGSAIVASVGAQAVSSYVAAKQFARAQAAERLRWEIERNAATDQLLLDRRRVLFADYLTDATQLYLRVMEAADFRKDPHYRDEERTERLLSMFRNLDEIGLVAPNILPFADYLLNVVNELDGMVRGDPEQQRIQDDELKFEPAKQACMQAMRRELGLAAPISIAHSQPQLNEGHMSGDSNNPGPTT